MEVMKPCEQAEDRAEEKDRRQKPSEVGGPAPGFRREPRRHPTDNRVGRGQVENRQQGEGEEGKE